MIASRACRGNGKYSGVLNLFIFDFEAFVSDETNRTHI